MALTPTVLTDAFISINSVTVSDHGNKVELPVKVTDLDATTFGQTWKVRRGGLKEGNVNVDFLNDFVATVLDDIMWAQLGNVIPFEVRPTSGARSTSNPGYTGSLLMDGWTPIIGKVGDLVTVSISFPTSGAVTRQTS
jgi:hypothetical protein